LFDDVDVTAALFQDIGWTVLGNPGELVFADSFR